MILNRAIFPEITKIISETACSTTASVASILAQATDDGVGGYFYITVTATTGECWVNPIETATTDSLKLSEGDVLDLRVLETLSMISDSTTAKVQAIVWKM